MRLTVAAVALLAGGSVTACTQPGTNGATTTSEAGTSSATSAAGTSGTSTGQQTTAGSSTGSRGSGTGDITSGGSSNASSSTGTTTGAPPPLFVDGGYVSCSLDAGPDGAAFWNCSPGTYFCDLSSLDRSCFQCRSDADCGDQTLPTYDPRKPHCDTSSGVPGYQNLCEECTANSDCAGNPNGSFCNQDRAVRFEMPPIETLGFETCNTVVADCRIDGGPVCGGIDESCDSQTGKCLTRSGACQSDDDCAGYLSPANASVLEPYCSDAGCSSCPGGFCPNGSCSTDDMCGNGQVCDLLFANACSCTDDSQCAGLWPACVGLDGSRVDDAGQALGYCGCDSDGQCGDGGLICLSSASGQVSFCGLSCASPGFPASCAEATGYPVCDPLDGACGGCTDDRQCKDANDPSGPRCDLSFGGAGNCSCLDDRDCPVGEVCQGGCTPALSRCTPTSCGSGFCNWNTGRCEGSTGLGDLPCLADFDCTIGLAASPNASICVAGTCLGCQNSADCVSSGAAADGNSLCCLPGSSLCSQLGLSNNTCVGWCGADMDCAGNGRGSGCVIFDGGVGQCGCGSDNDCIGVEYGHHCDQDPGDPSYLRGYCTCTSDNDCSSGEGCQINEGFSVGRCATVCFTVDGGYCAPGYFCDPAGACRPRCDGTNQCQGVAVCDTQNTAGQNGQMVGGVAAPEVTWCYSCLSPSDCPAGEGCEPKRGCGKCSSDANCPAGATCAVAGVCQATCATGPCPAGQVCDVDGVAGGAPSLCYQCISPADCPDGEGCNGQTHICGSCVGPSAAPAATDDCPPDAICSNYWASFGTFSGVCLANCDRTPCPAGEPICAVYPGLTPDHSYCFGCLQDSDCGPKQRCNVSPNPTFTCVDAR